MPIERHVRYIFADIESFTEGRTVDAQVEIVSALNRAFIHALGDYETICLPTGDGICAGVIQADAPADVHLTAALSILEHFHACSKNAPEGRTALVRLAIHESVDILLTDINGNQNLAGAGINTAQRLMSIADGGQIIVGPAAYETLRVRDAYVDGFRPLKAEVKHSRVIMCYQYVGLEAEFLNTHVPNLILRTNPIDLALIEEMERPSSHTTGGMVQAYYRSAHEWKQEMLRTLGEIQAHCNEEQRLAMESAQGAWEEFRRLECEFIHSLRETGKGTMYRPLGVSIINELNRERTLALRHYLQDWLARSSGTRVAEARSSVGNGGCREDQWR
jgi:class 3 adenylate cyclase